MNERQRATLRIILGNAQMFGAVCCIVLLLTNGLSAMTLLAFVFTCAAMAVSFAVFRDWWWRGS